MANEKKFEVAGNVSMVATGKKSVQVQEEFENVIATVDAGQGNTLADMYDRFSKLLYVVDASGSMGDGMLSEDSIKQYTWTDELLGQYRAWLKEQVKKENEEDELYVGDELDGMVEEIEDPDNLSDEELKLKILTEGLEAKSGIALERNYGYRPKGRSKMMAVKDAAKDFVHQRFQKHPDARVGVFQFEGHPMLLCAPGAQEEEVLASINRLPDFGGGSTDIFAAVDRAVNECRRHPSEVNAHHVVLVSDGCDYGAVNVKNLLPRMKELGMVFDFIYILGASSSEQADNEIIETLRGVCEATGGEFTTVKTEKDFVQKFLTVSNRPMLPPCR